jgi:peroxiredoxin
VLGEGGKTPDFSLPDQRWEQVKLSDLRGKPVVRLNSAPPEKGQGESAQ